LGNAFGCFDDILLASQLGIGFLEDFKLLAIVGLRLGNHFEHLNCLQQLSFFALIWGHGGHYFQKLTVKTAIRAPF